MNDVRMKRSIYAAAQNHNVSEEEVIKEIERCILEARKAAFQEGNKKAISMWQQIPSASEVPTADEFVMYIAEMIRKEVMESSKSNV